MQALQIHPSPFHPDWTESITQTIASGWRFSVRVLNKHTDLISSGGILIITTCLLAAKIFKNIPPLLPRIALAVYNFGGIIWVNVQVRDFLKSLEDLSRNIRCYDWKPCIEVAAQVFLKATNILLTCSLFCASVAAAAGFPWVLSMFYLTTRPLGLTSLAMSIATDLYDYFANKQLLNQMTTLENEPAAGQRIIKIMDGFLSNIFPQAVAFQCNNNNKEKYFANRLVQQLDMFTLETLKESLPQQQNTSDTLLKKFELFFKIKECMINKQAMTKSNLSLISLGYVSMGICKLYPDTLIEMATRWMMSVLYTDDLISQKLFQADLEQWATNNNLPTQES